MKYLIFLLAVVSSMQSLATEESRIMKKAMAQKMTDLTPAPFELRSAPDQEKYRVLLAGLNATSGKLETTFSNCLGIRDSYMKALALKNRTAALTKQIMEMYARTKEAADADAAVMQIMDQKLYQWAVCVADETKTTTENSHRIEQQKIDTELQIILAELARLSE